MATVLDTRPAAEFLGGHLPDSVNIPVGELARRVHELPAGDVPIDLLDIPEAGAAAAAFLAGRGHAVRMVPYDAARMTARGASRARLWQPNPFLAEALAAIGPVGPGATAIDVACGTGRDAVYLALARYSVTAMDHLPDALSRATDLAGRYGVSIRPVVHDLEATNAIPASPADLVCVFRYLHRPLFPALREAVRPGGHAVYETFHERNLSTGRSPRNPNHLLRTGELAEAFAAFEILISADAVERDGRYFSRILARRPVG